MAGGQERVLRRRIRSVESTKKITRAMELIAASRIVRAQQAIAGARPYVDKLGEVVSHLADTPDAASHPLFREVEAVQRVAIIVITADRGLAGGYNANVIRAAERRIRRHQSEGREVNSSSRAGKAKAISVPQVRHQRLGNGGVGEAHVPGRPTRGSSRHGAV